jgi:hypothetical protein
MDNLSLIHWILFTVTVITAVFFGLLAIRTKGSHNILPAINLFLSFIMMTNYLSSATMETVIVLPTIFVAMALNLPLMYYQTLLLIESEQT